MRRFTLLFAIPALVLIALLFLGGPLPQCLGGVGPSGDAGRAECARQWAEALPPLERFRYDHPLVVAVLAFVALVLLLLVADWAWCRRRGH
jgi:hypothetical protein